MQTIQRTPTFDPPPTHDMDSAALRQAGRGVARSWWIVVLCALIGAGIAVGLSASRPVSYQSAVTLQFGQASYQQAVAGGYNPIDAQRRLRTAADLVGVAEVSRRAARKVRDDTGRAPSGTVGPEFSADADTMRIVATSPDGKSAAALANATADAFLEYREEIGERALEDTRSVLRDQRRRAPTKADRRALTAKLNNIDALQTLDEAQIQVVERARVPSAAARTDLVRNGGIGLVLGALVGIAIGLFRTRPAPVPPPQDPWRDDAPHPDA